MTPAGRWRIAAFQVGALALAVWSATGEGGWLLLAAAGAAARWVPGFPRDEEPGEGREPYAGSVLLLAGVLAALLSYPSLDRIARDWPDRAERVQAELERRLAETLDARLLAIEESARAAGAAWSARLDVAAPEAGGGDLLSGDRSPGVDALAVFGPSGELLAWDGSHQGPVPAGVRMGASRWIYEEGALFAYLYATESLPENRGTAVAASLLRSELPPLFGSPREDFRSEFRRETGSGIEVSRADRALGESVFDLRWEGGVLFSVTLDPPSEAEAREETELAWIRLATVLLLAAWVLSLRTARGDPPSLAIAGGALPLLLVVLPLGRVTGLDALFSPADVLVPAPLEVTLGDLLLLGVAGSFLLGLVLPIERVRRARAPVAAAGGVAAVGILLSLATAGASRDFLASDGPGWLVFQGASAASAFALLGAALSQWGPAGSSSGVPRVVVAGSLGLGALLGIGWAALAGLVPPMWSVGLLLLWIPPVWGIAHALAGPGWSRALPRALCLGVLACTAVLPWGWNLRVHARMGVAEERVDRLGTRADSYLEFLLLRVGEEARVLASEPREPVEILYGAWTASGLAREGVPLWLTYWSPEGVAREELQIGVSGPRPPLRQALVDEARNREDPLVQRFDLADTHYIGVSPLPGGGLVSVVLPPRRVLGGGESPLGPLFSPARGAPDPLALIPLLPGEVPGATEGISWMRTEAGWQGETFLAYPDEVYHAHYLLELPGWLLLIARATLVSALNLAVLGIAWGSGRWLGAGGGLELSRWPSVFGTFRGRVTVTLFSFFLVPAALFGTLAYRTLSSASVRTAEVLAGRAVDDAASWYAEVGGAMDVLARRVGADLLLYEDGELVGASYPELLELGLYEGWLPPDVQEEMRTGEQSNTTAIAELGGWEYVVAYRRIPGGRTLAAPAPLQAGASALRQRDVADLLAFAVLLGGVLSILLSLLVGRALARPIQTLRVGSERVGAGNMSVRLPEHRKDEFGAVFDAFNRMVERLAQARRALQRTGRRTRAIVEEVATGVIALDSQGRVKLANPRAEELLGVALAPNEVLPREGVDAGREALGNWVEGYLRSGDLEAGSELSFGDRRIRVRARRISRKGPPGGAVVTLEDVTDELRTERILAWGEMAQQVAHEVKNPLTPIKLGVQHIRRAWEDDRPNYGEILDRNVDAILEEIDRLASIASSFSRFAAPAPADTAPLEPVLVPEVVREILDLYRAGEGPVRFESSLDPDLPPTRGRAGELKEVLVNLLENARNALPEGGNVSVSARREGGGVEIAVRDDGTGIPPELLARVFEPHFSTRSGGTGLGLAIVRRLVQSWGGTVALDSRSGSGTEVRIRLPEWRDGVLGAAGGEEGGDSPAGVP